MKKYRYVESGFELRDCPCYEHNCSACVFLGRYGTYDLYACVPKEKMTTVVARYDNEPSEYSSGIEFANGTDSPLSEAFERALGAGLIPDYWPSAYLDERLFGDDWFGSSTILNKFFETTYCTEYPAKT